MAESSPKENTEAHEEERHFWETRSAHYNELEWATRREYLERFVWLGDFRSKDVVLDVGTGTGIVAKAVAPLVLRVVGIDTSLEMLAWAIDDCPPNVEVMVEDVRDMSFLDGAFDKVTARMVFHHVLQDTQSGIRECHRVTKPGGRFVLSEGIPPHPELRDWYSRMFALKEERLTFLEEDLLNLMKGGGFDHIEMHVHKTSQASIKNWLENSGLPKDRQDEIFRMHLDLNERERGFYNLQVVGDDIRLDMKFLIIVGKK